MSAFESIKLAAILGSAFIFIAGVVLMTLLFKAIGLLKAIVLPGYKITSAPEGDEILEAKVVSIVNEQLRIQSFDSAMVLMEKQRLKKLEIEELELRLACNREDRHAGECHLSQ